MGKTLTIRDSLSRLEQNDAIKAANSYYETSTPTDL